MSLRRIQVLPRESSLTIGAKCELLNPVERDNHSDWGDIEKMSEETEGTLSLLSLLKQLWEVPEVKSQAKILPGVYQVLICPLTIVANPQGLCLWAHQ